MLVLAAAVHTAILLSGLPGSGKTHLADRWTRGADRLLVYDPMCSIGGGAPPDCHPLPGRLVDVEVLERRAARGTRWPSRVCAVQCAPDRFVRLLASVRDSVVLVDEAWIIAPRGKDGLAQRTAEVLRVRRQRNIRFVMTVQRPVNLHVDVRALCDGFAFGRACDPADLRWIAAAAGDAAAAAVPALGRGEFWWHSTMTAPVWPAPPVAALARPRRG